MSEIVTVVYFNHRLKQEESREHPVTNLTIATIKEVVDLFDAQIGTVLSVSEVNGRCLHRSLARTSDLMGK